MAAFCSKCGSPVAAGRGFCAACGAPVAGNAVSVPPVEGVAAAAPPPGYGQTAGTGYSAVNAGGVPPGAYMGGAPPRKSASGLKIALIVVAVVAVLAIVAVGMIGLTAWRVARAVHVNAGDNGVSISVPGGGTFSAGDTAGNDADLGVPVYPGAVRAKGGLNLNSKSTSMVMAHFTTADPVSAVTEFYKGKMPEASTVSSDSSDGVVLKSGGKDTDRIIVTVGKGSGNERGKTTIVVMRTRKNED